MIKQIITVHRKKFATGLFWQPLGVGNTAQNYAKHLSANNGKRYTLFIGFKSMVGLTDGREGARAGMPSAAVEIVNSLPELVSFLGVFSVDGKFYLVAVRNGVIIRDVLLETEEGARKLYTQLSGLPDWGALFAPLSWGIPKSQERNISDLIGKNVTVKLRQISVVKSVFPSVIFALLFVVFGVYILSNKGVERNTKTPNISSEKIAEYKQQIELKQQQTQQKKSDLDVNTNVEYPYDNLPDMMERAKLCYKAIAFVMQPLPGWNQTYAKCDEEFVSATFIRDFGTLNDFYEIGADLMPGAIVQQISEDEILVRIQLPKLKTYSSLDERNQSVLVRDITTLFQQTNINADIHPVTDTIVVGNKTENLYVTEIGVQSKLIPSEFMYAFNGTGGVYMTSVTWRANTKSWDYEVIIYSK